MYKSNIHIDAAQLQEAYACLGELKKVAQEFGCSAKIIKKLMIKYDLPYWSSKIDHNLDLYIETYQKYKSLTEAAEELGIHLETLRQVFIKNNIPYNKQLVYAVDHNAFDILTPASMYWGGFLAADGNIEKHKDRIKLELMTDDKGHIEKFKFFIKTNAPIINTIKIDNRPQFKSPEYYSSNIRFTSTLITQKLREHFNIVPMKSLTYTFPEHLKDHHLIHHFIRGLIDGDGWIYDTTNDPHKTIGLSGTPNVVKTVLDILCSTLGLSTTGNLRLQNTITRFDFNRLNDLQKIITYLYQGCGDLYLDRKYKSAQNIMHLQPRKISISYDVLRENYERLGSHVAMAKELGCSNSTIKRRMIELGLYKA